MRSPSRFIRPRTGQALLGAVPLGALLLGALLLGFGYFLYASSDVVRCGSVVLIFALYVPGVVTSGRELRRFEEMSRLRAGESICDFARCFNTRQTDTWVIRAAHQEVQRLLQSYLPDFPVRASDSLLDDLPLEDEDIDDLVVDIAARSGHSLTDTKTNPFYGKIKTVSDLVLFIDAQPRMMTVRPC